MSSKMMRQSLIFELPVITSITMDEFEPSAVGGDIVASLDDEDALLRDALAFIGDLDFDLDTATPDEDDELSARLPGGVSDVLSPLPISLLDPVAPPFSNAVPQAPGSADDGSSASHATCSDHSSVLLPQTEPDIAKPKIINRSRTKRLQELAYLRGLVGDLEERLTELKSSQEDPAPASPSVDSGCAECAELVEAWAQVASHQHAERQRAETENSKLKQLLQEQIRVGKSLERLLTRKRRGLASFEQGIAAEKRLRRSNSRAWNNELIFDELVADCDALYANMERVVALVGSLPLKPRRDIRLVHDPELGMTMQMAHHRIVPFSYEDTVDVVWSSFPEVSTVNPPHVYHDVDLTDDTMKLQFRVMAELGRARGDFTVKLVIRRYNEANRTVVVTSGIVDPSEISQTNMAGVRMRHSGWHVFEPMPATPSAPHGATKELILLRAVPEVDDELQDQSRKVGALTNFVMSSLSLEIESRSQQIDNRLLDLSLKHRTGM